MKIKVSGCKFGDNSQILNRTSIHDDGDTEIEFKDTEITGNAQIMEDMEIGRVFDILREQISKMDNKSIEYLALQELLDMEKTNNRSILRKIGEHLATFSEGVWLILYPIC